MLQHDNGIHIRSWYNDPLDRELDKLLPFLKGLVQKGTPDVRTELKAHRYHGGGVHGSPEAKCNNRIEHSNMMA